MQKWKRTSLSIALNISLPLILFSSALYALPQGGHVVGGSAQIHTPNASTMQVNQGSSKAVIDWRSYNIGKKESVIYKQPNAKSISLNRINPNQGPSQIFGSIKANGQVWLVNPAGIWFGPTAHVDVAGLLATTASIRASDFMNGNYKFQQSSKWNGSIQNDGEIIIRQNGLAALVAPGVVNNGRIEANMGTVVLGASTKFTVDFTGDQLINFEVGGEVSNYATDHNGKKLSNAVINNGAIVADAGKVIITAQAAGQVLDHTINMTGVVEAKSVGTKNGEIILGDGSGTTYVSGKVIASGRSKGSRGGVVKILANKVILDDQSVVSASGDQGGGSIYIGGNYHGSGPLPNADYVYFSKGASIDANALSQGNGGTVILWSNIYTQAYGNISAKGGLLGGNGGFIETSGHDYLNVNGITVNAQAPYGELGTWLLDPENVTIVAGTGQTGGSFNGSNPNVFTPTAINSQVGATTIVNNLNSANVTITTGSTGTQAGNIVVSSAITNNTTTNTLLLTAAGTIAINAPISLNLGTLQLSAGSNTSAITATAAITVNSFNLLQGAFSQNTATLPTFTVKNNFTIASGASFLRATSGNGTTLPYVITDVYGLQGMASIPFLTTNFTLGGNIDAYGTNLWNNGGGFAPIGPDSSHIYTGTFNGANFTISNLAQVVSSGGLGGLFGYAGGSSGTVVQNITLKNLSITAATANSVGGLITNLTTGAGVTNASVMDSTISNSGGAVGGLLGVIGGSNTVTNVYAMNTTITAATGNTGGVIGLSGRSSVITNAHSSGTINGANGINAVGGVAGGLQNGTVLLNSSSSMNINVQAGSASNIGGLVGACVVCEVTSSYATGNINIAANGVLVGGLVGWSEGGVLTNIYATGAITMGGTGTQIGGLVGGTIYPGLTTVGSITNGYSSGLVSVAGTPTSVGGFVGGMASGTLSNSFWDVVTTGQANGYGSNGATISSLNPVTTANFYTTAPFSGAGWSITSTLTAGTTVPIDSSTGNPYVWFVFPGQTRPLLIAQWNTNVSTPEQLQLTGAVLGASYTQINNIDLTKSFTSTSTTWNPSMGFIPIGYTTAFLGNYNGQNYTINGLVITDNSANAVGLFGTTAGSAALSNIGVTNAVVTKGGTASASGILLGVQSTTTASIYNSYTTGSITSIFGDIGGLIGATANGTNANAVNYSYSTASVTGTTAANGNIGGLVGYLGTGETIQNSYATGTVKGASAIGGLVGGANQGIIKTSYSGGSVIGNATTGIRLGGLVGLCVSCTISDSYSYASVTGATGISNIGGLAGQASGAAITNTYSSGLVTANGSTVVGGFMGTFSGALTSSFWDTVTSGQPTVGISSGSTTGLTGLTTNQFFTLSNFTGASWSITNTPTTTAVKPTTTWFMFTANGNTRPMLMMEWQPNMVNAHQLQMVGTTLGASYTVANNIDLSSSMTNPSDVWATNANSPSTTVGSGFVPIGYMGTNLFTGTFNGANYTISNLYVGVTASATPTNVDAGLFGNTNNATIKNVDLVDANVTGYQFVGALLGYGTNTAISNSYVNSVNGSYITAPNSGSVSIGGLVGRLDGGSSINTSFSNAIINVGASSAGVGGLIGYLNTGSTITNAYSLSPIFILPTGSIQVGGFVGLNSGIINNAYSTGTIRGAGIASLGGFVGSNTGTIKNAFWDIATSSLTAGFGTNTGTITNLTGSTFASSLSTQSTYTNVGWGFGGPINGASPWVFSAGAYPYFSVAATGYAELSGAAPAGSAGTTVNVSVNGVTTAYTTTIRNIDGSYYISAPIAALSGKDILVWLAITGSSAHANAVGFGAASGTGTVATSGSINSLDLVSDQITVGSSNALYATPISNTDLGAAVGTLSDPGIMYSASGNNITLATSSYNKANLVVTSITPYTMTGNILSTAATTTSAIFNNKLTVSPASATLTTLGGNITFNGAVTATSNFTVNAGGNIAQAASAPLTIPGTLTATAGGSIGLSAANNAINTFGATASGAIDLLNTASTLTLNAVTENSPTNVTINNTGNISVAGWIKATSFPAVIYLTSSGSITETSTGSIGNNLVARTVNGLSLLFNGIATNSPKLATLTASNTGLGDITIVNQTTTGTNLGNITNAGGNFSFTQNTGFVTGVNAVPLTASGSVLIQLEQANQTLTLTNNYDVTGTGVTYIADHMVFNTGALTNAGTGLLTLQPFTAGVGINIGTGVATNTANILGLPDLSSSFFTGTGGMTIGSAQAGTINVSNTSMINGVTGLISLLSGSDIQFTSTGSLTSAGNTVKLNAGGAISNSSSAVNITANQLVATAVGNVNVTGNVSTLAGSSSTGGFAYSNASNALTIGTVNSVAGITANGGNIAINSGALTLAQVVNANAGNITLTSSGTISETGAGAVKTTGSGLVTTSSVGGTLLGGANLAQQFNATNITSGNISLINTAATLVVTSISQAGTGLVSINNTGNLTTSGAVVTSGSGTIGLTATTGILTVGANVTGTSGGINLASTGASNDVLFNAGTVNTTGSINVNAGRDISLQAGIIGLNTTSGPSSVTLAAARDVLSAAGTEISANPTTGTVTLNAGRNINSAGAIDPNNVVLTAVGTISQEGAVTANLLTATSATNGGTGDVGDITINNAANNFAAISATNSGGSGSINILDNVSSLNIVSLLQNNTSNTSGTVTLQNTGGSLVLNGNVVSHGGVINLANSQTSGATFTNNIGSGAINAGGGVYRIWSYSPAADVVGNLNAGYVQYNATYGTTMPAVSSANGLLYAIAATLNVGVTATKTYDGSTSFNLSAPNYIINSGVINNDVVTATNLSSTSINTSSANAGVYSINPSISYSALGVTGNPGASNSGIPVGIPVYGYDVNVASGTATITPATLTYTADPATRIYGAANPTFTGTVSGFVNGETQASATSGTMMFTTSADVGSNVGSYPINGGGLAANNGNYVFVQDLANATALTITPATLTYVANPVSKTYGTANPSLTGSVSGFVNGDTQASATSGTLAFTTTATMGSSVGSYAIDGSGLTASNYIFAQAPGNAAALTITAATLTYTADSVSRTYGTANPSLTGSVIGFVNGDTQASATSGTLAFTTTATMGSNVGSYAIDGSGLTASNYVFVQAPSNSSALTITPATLTYTANAANKIYGSANPAFSGSVSGFVNGDTQISATTGTLSFMSSATTSSNVGTYSINGTGLAANNGNYVFVQAASNSTAFTINPATLTYTANAASKTYGSANPTFSGTITGYVLGQNQASATTGTASFTSTAIDSSDVGTYAITGGGLTALNGNYVFAQAPSNASALTINPAVLTYTANAASRTYGAANPIFTGTVTGFVLGQDQSSATTGTLSFTSTADASNNVGSYAINGSGLVATNGNYTFTQAASNATALTITPASLVYVANAASRHYGDANPAFSGSVSGFLNGDTQASATSGTLTFTSPATVTSDVNTYAINGSGLTATNYTFTQDAGNATALQVTPRPVTIGSVSAQDKVYDSTTNATLQGAPTANNIVNGDVITVTGTGTGTFAQKDVGNNIPVYINGYTLSGTKAADYAITLNADNAQVTSSANITPATINTTNITANSRTYDADTDASINTGTAGLSGVYSGDNVSLDTSLATGAFADKNVGTGKVVTINNLSLTGSEANDYVLSNTTTTADITPYTLNVTGIVANDKTYDGTTTTTLSNTGTLQAPLGSDTVNLNTTSYAANFANPNVGTNIPVTVTGYALTGADAGNYVLASPLTTTANITPATINIDLAANNFHITYGDTYNFAGTEFSTTSGGNPISTTITSVTFNVAGMSGSDVVDAGKAVGDYAITPSNAQGTDLSNYNINYINGTVTIDPRPVNIINVTAQTKAYDGTTAATINTSGAQLGNVYGTDNVTLGIVNSQGTFDNKNVGTNKTVTITGTFTLGGADASNYVIANPPGTTVGDITPATLTITANSGQSKVYGTANPTYIYAASGFVSGDSTSNSLTGALTRDAGENVGNYNINQGTLAATSGNYTIDYHSDQFAITPAPLTITANSGSKTYGDTYTALTGTEFTTSGLVTGDSVSTVTLTSAGAVDTAVVNTPPVGHYAITPSAAVGSGLSNYTISYVNGDLAVNQKPLTVSGITTTGKVYDGTTNVNAGEVQFSGASVAPLFSDQVTLDTSGITAQFVSPNAGANTININGLALTGADVGNYSLLNPNVAIPTTVTPKTLSIVDVVAHDKTYDSTTTAMLSSTGALSGVVGSDDVTLGASSVTANFVDANVGNAKTVDVNGYTLGGSAANNYQLLSPQTTTTASITPANLTITANNGSKTYGDTVTFNGNEFTTSGLLGSDAVNNVSLSSAGAINTANVGNYAITGSNAQGSGLANYTIAYVDGNLAVSAKALTITANDITKTYGDTVTLTGNEFTPSGLVNGDTVSGVTLTSSGAAASATVSGSPYAIVASNATGATIGNYAITYVNGNLNVLTKDITLTPNSTNKIYGNTTSFNGTEFTAPGLVNGDTISSVTLSSGGAAASAGVGNYDIIADPSSVVGTGLNNYNINYATGTLTVNPKTLNITANNDSKVYGQTAANPFNGYTVSGLVNSDNVSSVDLASTGGAANANVGSYGITASNVVGSGLSNYTIQLNSGTLTVTPLALTITAKSDSKTYGSAYTFSGNEFTETGLVNGDTVSTVSLSSTGAATTAQVSGSPYAISASNAVGSGLGNYTINYVDGNLTVNPKAITVSSTNASKTYGNAYTFSGTEFTVSGGLVNGDSISTVTLTSPGTPKTAAVGPYAILPSNATGSGLSNYTISYQSTGVLTVSPASLTITANSTSKTYGSTINFSGNEYSVSGLVNSDSVSSVVLSSTGAAATAQVNGSPYAIVASNAAGSGLSNYNINYVNGSLVVNSKALTITANNATKTYGDTVSFSGNEYSVSGLTNSDAVSSVALSSTGAAAAAQVNGSPYAIVASNAAGSGLSNYTINYVNGNLTVNSRPLTISSTNASKGYGNAYTFSGNEYAVSGGLVNGDTITHVTLGSAGAPAAATVGAYAVTVSNATGTGLSNYAINYQNSGVLTVSPASLTITANSTSKTYGDTVNFSGHEYSVSGLMNSDGVSSVTLTSNGAAATAQVTGSPYAIVANNAVGSGLSNYTINYVNGSLLVNPKALTITANNTSKTYGDAPSLGTSAFSTSGLVNSDSVSTVTLNSTGTAATAQVSGSPYAIVASNAAGSGLNNYIISYVNGNLTVNPKNIIVSSTNASKTYGDAYAFNGTEFTVSGLVNGDTIHTVNLVSAGTPVSSSVGAYGITVNGAVGTGLSNYNITYQNAGVLTVNPATLTITANGLTKTYDTTTYAGGNGVTYSGFVAGDSQSALSGTLSYAGSAQGAHDVGTYFIVPQGLSSTNYNINYIQNNLVIKPATVYVSGITANNKTYDATAAATVNTNQLSYSGVLGSDVVNVDASNISGAFYNKMVGNGKLVTITGLSLSGSGSINYVMSLAPIKANITPAVITVNGILANNKNFDGNNRATLNLSQARLSGVLTGDNVSLTGKYNASFASSSAGNNIPVNIGYLQSAGADVANYTLVYPNNLTANIIAMNKPSQNVIQATIIPNPVGATQLNQTAVSNLLSVASCTSSLSVTPVVSMNGAKAATLAQQQSNAVCDSNATSQTLLWSSQSTQNATISLISKGHGLQTNEVYIPESGLINFN